MVYAQPLLANTSLCPFTIYMSCIIIVIFFILFSLLKMVIPGFFTCLNCTYPPRASINVTLTRSLPWFYLEAFISHASKLSKDFIYASLTTVITFYFFTVLISIISHYFKHSQYLSMIDLCIFHNVVHSRCSIYYWLKQGYNSREVTMTVTVMIAYH